MSTEYVPVNELVDQGYLQEVNRRFFHPLGLALTVMLDDDNPEESKILGIRDYRSDPVGVSFHDSVITDPEAARKQANVDVEFSKREEARIESIGSVVQKIQ